ncbi:patatin-like phospholipase family protein [Aliikangiella coralliicola]|uniref:Patatin-like phospholipase family protein n=1 Tax=Aliikangiella coralliicola TaxID=2592383 RepID=A0A545UH34_9GAMM|nr:patatin-like phospholipase family protein [Aliikangiella coralliicola]TQV88781.1 patatin-like phospholipase family protein [Aliikangiella coralliicola]
MSTSISVYAGSKALKQIQSDGISQQQFEVLAGASGGPKWFTLFGLDCYLFGEFFTNRKEPIHTIGSSAGSWRLACFAQEDPVGAIKRLAHYYSNETYSTKPDADEISSKAIQMLDKVLGTTGEEEIANSQLVQSHFIVAKAKGLNRSENRFIQMSGLVSAAAANMISRSKISQYFDRYVFHTHNQYFDQSFFKFDDMPTHFVNLSTQNIHQVLIASGAIPLVLRGVGEIPGAPDGVYRDGGIIDYHLDLNFNTEKLVLYPHFFPSIKPGWFDKKLKKRNASHQNYENVVLITPSPQHVASLPYQKISDRTDFEKMDEKSRIQYWQKVLDESHKMADDFKQMVEQGIGLNSIIPIENIL